MATDPVAAGPLSLRDLPLLELFNQLRAANLPLGIEEYEWLLRAMQAGYGLGGVEDLAWLCRTLWVKSEDEAAIFAHLFHNFITTSQAAPPKTEPAAAQPATEPRPPVTPEDRPATPPTGPTSTPSSTGGPERAAAAQPETTPTPMTPQLAEAMVKMDEVAARVMHGTGQLAAEEAITGRYRLNTDYLPITRRQMKQSWRYLRKAVREGPPVELDVEATVHKTAADGLLYDLVLRPRRINRADLVLLFDWEGSMVPFHSLARRLTETALRGGRLGRAGAYYFQNWPAEYLYTDPHFNEAIELAGLLDNLHPVYTAILIFSDAGAARGHFNVNRVQATRDFLGRLRQTVRYAAWLNPMPARRWTGSSAAAIARFIPMFEISRRGLQDAIGVLRGRHIPGREATP